MTVVRAHLVQVVLWVFGLISLTLGVWELMSPGSFFDNVGPFGARNDHYIRDSATFELANALVLLVAVRRASWRVPVLAFTAARYGLHDLNHWLDLDKADPQWVGVFDAIALGLGCVWLVAALLLAAKEAAVSAT